MSTPYPAQDLTGHAARLASMLAGSLLLAGAAAATEEQEQARSEAKTAAATERTGTLTDADVEHITVSARRREDPVLAVPVAVTRFGEQQLDIFAIENFVDYASLTPSLSFAYGNGATASDAATGISTARTVAIRGIAGARTTGFYLDDTPIPAAVDVRVIDLDSIEVLKGPQGTLFGESSLGGNIRLLSKAPDLDHDEHQYRLAIGRLDGVDEWNRGGDVISNVVIEPATSALRLVAFADHEAGFLSRSYRSDVLDPNSPRLLADNQGAVDSYGGSLSLRRLWSEALRTDFRLLVQQQDYYGFPASYAPLPAFEPVSTLDHTANIQPFVHDRWSLPSLSLQYQGEQWQLVASLSYFDRETEDLEDSTEGTARYWGSSIPQGFAWLAEHRNQHWSQETRLHFTPTASTSATAGIFLARQANDFDIPAVYGQLGSSPGATSLLWLSTDHSEQTDRAVFAEFYYQFLDDFTLTFGGRQYWLEQKNDLHFEILTTRFTSRTDNKESGFSPKLALHYALSNAAMVYASAAEGFRAGGAQFNPAGFGCDADLAALGVSPEQMTRIEADTTRSYEVGSKWQLPDSGLLLTGAVFHIDWDNIQQHLFLPSCGFYMQGNAGAADIDGAELELSGRLSAAFTLRFGVGYQDARISEQGGTTGQRKGDRIYQTPEWTGSLALAWQRALSEQLQGFASLRYSYTGDSLSANSGANLQLTRASYQLLNLRTGLQWRNNELALTISNLTNEQANLGDIGYIGYQRYESDDLTPRPQVVTLPPRAIMLQFRQQF